MSRVRFNNSLCPVCGQSNGKCAGTEDGEGIICWTFRDVAARTEKNGLTCTKSSSDTDSDLGSVWFPTELAFSTDPFDRLCRIYERAQQQPEPQATALGSVPTPSAQPTNVHVSVADRDERHRQLLKELAGSGRFEVSRAHAEAMAKRLHSINSTSIRQRMIERGYFSVTSTNQRVHVPWPIPGAVACAKDRWELRPARGLYSPLRDCNGHILGWELRKDSDKKNKYHVLSRKVEREGSADSCVIEIPETGEQPLSWCLPPSWAQEPPKGGYAQILLTEGKGIKPQVVADLFGLPVLGCGGSMAGGRSPSQLLDAAKQLAAGGQLILFADAGWLINPDVAMAMAETVAVLERAGHLPLIAGARPWVKEKSWREPGDDAEDPERRFDREMEVYLGSDPDELPSWAFVECLHGAKPLSDWVQDHRTPEEVRAKVDKGLAKIANTADHEDHLRRGAAANRRSRHSITPRLLRSELPKTVFAPSEQGEATVAAIKRCRKSEAQRFAAFAEPLLPQCRKAERDAIRRYWHTYPIWRRWAWEPGHYELKPGQEHQLTKLPPPRLMRLVRKALDTCLVAEAWCEVLRCERAENLPFWQRDLLEALQAVDKLTGTQQADVLESLEYEISLLQKKHPYKPLPAVVFNTSGTGAGKTHTIANPHVAEALRVEVGGHRQGAVIYLNTNYRTPAVGELLDWNEVPARHGGLIRTEDGRLKRADESTSTAELVEPANCRYAFRLAQIVERGHDIGVTSKWCNGHCPYRPEKWEGVEMDGKTYMKNVGGDGSCSWVKNQLRPFVNEVVRPESTRSPEVQTLRTGTDGLIGLASYGPAFLANALVVIDECDQLKGAVTQTITLDHDDLMAIVEALPRFGFSSAESQTQARGLIEALDRLLDPPPAKKGRDHGMGVQEVRTDHRVQRALQVIAQTHRSATDGSVQLTGGWQLCRDAIKTTEAALLAVLDRPEAEAQSKGIRSVAQTVLPDLIAAVMPELMGAAGQSLVVAIDRAGHRTRRVLRLSRRKPEFTAALEKAGATLVLDATERPEDVMSLLRFSQGDAHLDVINVANPRLGGEACDAGATVNLLQVPCLGGLGRQRSTQKIAERDAVIDGWVALAPDAEWGVIDHGKYCRSAAERAWLTVMARGGNFFETASRLALVGLPIKNLGAIDQETEIIFGSGTANPSSEAYRQWQSHLVAIELVQGIGRLRANRRSADEVLQVLLLTDANLAPLCQQMGWPIPTPTRKETFTCAPRPLKATEAAFEAVQQYLAQCLAQGREVPTTQKEACRGANTDDRTFRRACDAKGTNFYALRCQTLKRTA